jgi:peptidyl-prolyl cis-trans isomerase SurA
MSALLEDGEAPPDDPEQASAFREVVLDRLVEERLIIQEAKRLGLTADPEEVAERVQALRREFAPKERFEQMLREAQLTEEQLKTKLREQLLMQRAIDGQVRAAISVSPAELQQAAVSATRTEASSNPDEEEVLAAHLLIRVSEKRSVEEARQLIDQLTQRLLTGEAFESLARVYSEGPHAEEGGRLGWVKPDEMLPELASALSTLPPGQVSQPIQSALGFHLVKVLERRQKPPEDFPDSPEAAHHRLYQQKFANAMRAWLDTLKRGAYIHVMEE